MGLVPHSGYAYPNKFGRLIILALKDVMGQNGIDAILDSADLSELKNNYPPNDLNKEFDFATLSSILISLEQMYGARGGRGLAARAGRALFADGLKDFGPLVGLGDLALRVLPISSKLSLGLPAFAKIFNQVSDQQVEVDRDGDDYLWRITRCPVCWGRTESPKPVCDLAGGLLEESLEWASGGGKFIVVEEKCVAMGHQLCQFRITVNGG